MILADPGYHGSANTLRVCVCGAETWFPIPSG